MTREETAKMLSWLKLAYPGFYRDLPASEYGKAVSLWHRYFGQADASDAAGAVDHYIINNAFPPAISQLLDLLEKG